MKLMKPILIGAVLYLSLLGVAQILSPLLVLKEEGLLLHKFDDQNHVAIELRKVWKSKDPRRLFLVLGSSTFREAFDTDDMQKKLAPYNLDFQNLSTSDQSITDSWAILDSLDSNRKAIVVLGINPLRLRKSAEDLLEGEKFGFAFPRYNDLDIQGKTVKRDRFKNLELSQFFIVLKRSWEKKFSTLIRSGKVELHSYHHHQYDDVGEWAKSDREIVEKFVEKSKSEISQNLPASLSVMSKIVEMVKTRGWQLVILDGPLSREAKESLGPSLETYENGVEKWTEENHVRFFRPQAKADLLDQDFHDYMHLLPSGRAKYSAEVFKELSEQLTAGIN